MVISEQTTLDNKPLYVCINIWVVHGLQWKLIAELEMQMTVSNRSKEEKDYK